MKTMGDRLRAENCPLVLIEWEDSRQPHGAWQWLSKLGNPKPVKCATVGWLLKDGPEAKVICQSMGDIEDEDDMQAGGVMTIPARCVLSIVRLTEDCPALMPPGSGACQGAPKRKVVPGDYNTLAKSSKSP